VNSKADAKRVKRFADRQLRGSAVLSDPAEARRCRGIDDEGGS
jgi:hypothetical protein